MIGRRGWFRAPLIAPLVLMRTGSASSWLVKRRYRYRQRRRHSDGSTIGA
jgi:hypothetical protein